MPDPAMKVALVAYGIGNVRSVANALERAGAMPEIVTDGDGLRRSAGSAIVMPGVGAVGEALSLLHSRGLVAALNDLVGVQCRPFLGICVGMQVMAEVCEEFGEHVGLGWIPGRIKRLEAVGATLRVPHVGWNTIAARPGCPVLAGLDGEHFYFVHSYALSCPPEFVAATSDYGAPFVAAVQRGNIMGVQFHPEKSSLSGTLLLRQFLSFAASPRAQAAE